MSTRSRCAFLLGVAVALLVACGERQPGSSGADVGPRLAEEAVLNFFNWSDYIAPDTIAGFERETGIKVRSSFFDTNEILESKVLTGHSGFDVVVPTAPFLQRQVRSGAYLELDKNRLPNLAHLDPAIMARVALNDPGNAHGVVYVWGTYGIAYDTRRVAAALPGVPLTSWRILFDPANAAKLAACGISTLDAPEGVVRLVLTYLGRQPNAPSAQDLRDAEAVLLGIRPYIRTIDTTNMIETLANGDSCIAIAYQGDFFQARRRAREAKNGIALGYLLPDEGSLLWFDMLAIPRDAPHPANALRFIDYLMRPAVMAGISNFLGYANANVDAAPLLEPALLADPAVYPPADRQRRLFVQTEDSPEQARAITRLWQRFKTGQ